MLAKIGALFYLIWGILHVKASIVTYEFGATLPEGLAQGRIYQDAWTLMFFAIAVSVIAIKFNWKNSKTGFWLNLILASAADLGFILHILAPGHIPFFPGIMGPVLWILAMLFATLAFIDGRKHAG